MRTLIKNVSNIQTGLFAQPAGKGDAVYLQARHFNESGELVSVLYPDLKDDYISDKHRLKPGDVLFAAKGTKNFAVVYEDDYPPAVASTSFFVIRITDDTLLPKYAAWFLNHPDTQEFLKGKAKGTSMPSIKKADLEELEIPVPSLEKQQLIIQLGALSRREAELRHEILSKRQQIVNQQIINAIKG